MDCHYKKRCIEYASKKQKQNEKTIQEQEERKLRNEITMRQQEERLTRIQFFFSTIKYNDKDKYKSLYKTLWNPEKKLWYWKGDINDFPADLLLLKRVLLFFPYIIWFLFLNIYGIFHIVSNMF